MIGWGLLTGGVGAVARRLASGRTRDVLGPGVRRDRRAASREGGGGRLGRTPLTRRRPIGAGDRAAGAAGAAAARSVPAAP